MSFYNHNTEAFYNEGSGSFTGNLPDYTQPPPYSHPIPAPARTSMYDDRRPQCEARLMFFRDSENIIDSYRFAACYWETMHLEEVAELKQKIEMLEDRLQDLQGRVASIEDGALVSLLIHETP